MVIVIAVIAILSAVLIPTFGAIIKDANVAADQTAAASLTSELHIYLKGNTIDSEEELMAALEESGVNKKLVPKALAYGNHFWFDMENQMIISGSAKEIQEGRTPVVNTTANKSFRDVYGIGVYFIDYSGELANYVDTIDTLSSGSDYQRVVKGLIAFENKDDELGAKLLDAVQNTIIISKEGSFYCEGATNANVTFVNGGVGAISQQFVADANGNVSDDKNGETTNLPSVSGDVVLPKNMSFVGDNALNFNGNANIVVTPDRLETVFCENATNATINNDYTVEGNKLMKDDEEIATLVSLDGRFPYYSFGVLQQNDESGNTYAWNSGTLYVNYYQVYRPLPLQNLWGNRGYS